MPVPARPTHGFPTARIESLNGGLPIEVCLIAQLGPGGGDHLFTSASGQQRAHASFVDELHEPSAKLFGIDLSKADSTSLYSFAVDAAGHPFHRHAGHRVFTAISGSGGAQLRFSTITDRELQDGPKAFLDSLHFVDIPPDSLFVVRFGGGTWHQFAARHPGSPHPVLFALSCHTDELSGIKDAAMADSVRRGDANFPSLTELLPAPVQHALESQPLHALRVPTTTLSLHAPPESLASRTCARVRDCSGRLRRFAGSLRQPAAFIGRSFRHSVSALASVPNSSLLARQFQDGFDHEDMFALTLPPGASRQSAEALLAAVLDGFLSNPPQGVSWLMQLRNVLVRPLRLRTSPLGCPVSSLLSPDAPRKFAGRYPVLDQRTAHDRAEVLLGADDRHLRFRSCVGVEIVADGIRVTLGTRVHCRNLFGRVYMAMIEAVHRHYISPTMLEMAVAHALQQEDPPLFAVPAAG